MRVDFEGGRCPRASGRKYRPDRAGPRLMMPVLMLSLVLAPGAGGTASAQGGLYGGPPEESRQENELPAGLRDVGIEQKSDGQLPLDLVFRDDGGREVRVGDYFRGRPVILAPVYYECPMLCNQVLNGLTGGLRGLHFGAGEEFEVVAVSFDPRETPEIAAAKKVSYVRRYGRPGAEAGWHFLTGDQQSITRLTDAVGFRYRWDAASSQFAHASAVIVLTPRGKISRYFYGIDYAPSDLRLGIVEASEGKVGSPVDQLLLYCFHYDPGTGKYGAAAMNVLRLFGVVFLAAAVLFFVITRRRGRGGRVRQRLRNKGSVSRQGSGQAVTAIREAPPTVWSPGESCKRNRVLRVRRVGLRGGFEVVMDSCPMKKFPRVSLILVIVIAAFFAARWLGLIG